MSTEDIQLESWRESEELQRQIARSQDKKWFEACEIIKSLKTELEEVKNLKDVLLRSLRWLYLIHRDNRQFDKGVAPEQYQNYIDERALTDAEVDSALEQADDYERRLL